MTRYRAAGIHLIISGIITLMLLAVMFRVWYPNEYFKLMRGDDLIYLILSIDLCLGPLLTLVVFKTGKKSLKFDLTIIALLQVSALAYGTYTMINSRPVFTAYADGEFSIATALELTDAELMRASRHEWKTRSLTGPIIVAVIKPTNKKELEEIEFLSFGAGYARFPRLFVSYSSQQAEILRAAKPLNILRTYDKKNSTTIDAFLSEIQRNEQDFAFVPISSFFKEMTVILDAKTAEFITIIDATPKAPKNPKRN